MVIDVIVLSKDRPDYFKQCVGALNRTGRPYTGYLVNNGTDQETTDIAVAHGWEVMTPGYNTSYAEGNNLALAASQNDEVLLLNNDAFLSRSGALTAMLDHDAGIVGCVTVRDDGRVTHAGGRMQDDQPLHSAEIYCRPVPWVTFAAVLISREVINDVGPLDEGFWYSYEDVDYCLRARAAGWDVVVCADAVVEHAGLGTRGLDGDAANSERYFAKHVDHTMPIEVNGPDSWHHYHMAHRDKHPEYVDGCFGCKALTLNVGAGAKEVRGAAVREMDAKDKALDKDLASYKRLRANGLQPKSIDGSSQVESVVTSQFDIDLGHVVPKEFKSRVQEGFALAKDMEALPS